MQSYTFIPTSANHFHLCRPPKENIGSIYFEKQKLIKENKQTPDFVDEIQCLLTVSCGASGAGNSSLSTYLRRSFTASLGTICS